jgi:polar amino acid transport system substrate-binding protein
MKNICKLFVLILLSQHTLFAQKINILYDTQSDGTIYPSSVGIVNMIKEAGKTHNIKVNFEGAPWNRALELVKSGEADGLINASYNESRAKYAVYPLQNGQPDISKSLQAPAYYLYTRKENNLKFDGKKLINANGSIGVVKSYAVVDNLKKLNAKIKYGINTASNLQNVIHKTFIATAELAHEADPIINSNPILQKELKKLPIAVRKKEYYLIISKSYYKKNPKIVHTLWEEIKRKKVLKKKENKN